MPQIHFYVPEDLASKIRDRAEAAGLSVSRYVADVVKTELVTDWPEGFFEKVPGAGKAGHWSDRAKPAPTCATLWRPDRCFYSTRTPAYGF